VQLIKTILPEDKRRISERANISGINTNMLILDSINIDEESFSLTRKITKVESNLAGEKQIEFHFFQKCYLSIAFRLFVQEESSRPSLFALSTCLILCIRSLINILKRFCIY
jgi:hypothetical protein